MVVAIILYYIILYYTILYYIMGRDSVVGIATTLRAGRSGNRIPVGARFSTNSTWTDPGSNPGLRNERPATKRLSRGTAHLVVLLSHR
jgi:hypothetical protein